MLNDKDRLFDNEGRSFALTHNLKGDSITSWVKQFEKNETNRQRHRSNSVFITHEIISWHREDTKHITLAKMETMAREYIKQRNQRGLYVAVPHFDRSHFHIHVCASGVDQSGKSLRLPKPELQKLKKEFQQYQIDKFPELSKSIVNHGKGEKPLLTEKEYQFKLRTGRETEKEQVIEILKTCFKKSISKNDFYTQLKKSGLETYERSGKITGIKKGNIKFRFSRLGFTEQRIEELNKSINREKELFAIRKDKQKIINRSR